MPERIINIDSDRYTKQENRDGELWRQLDLSGEHLGVRIEELNPGGTSSYNHFHTLEEEHVLIISGSAAMHFGEKEIPLSKGDHVWFRAGEEIPHYLQNNSNNVLKYLVFGERKEGDVLFYPDAEVVLVKALENMQLKYKKS